MNRRSQATARRLSTSDPHLRLAPRPEEVLRAEIHQLCAQADLRLGNPPGTAERGIYFWHWPPQTVTDPTVLTRLHADAVALLFDTVHPTTERNQP